MVKPLLDWVDNRTGCKKIIHLTLYENVPGGARWRYVWGSTLTFGLMVQIVTGIFLWMAYSPSAQTAWESVYYIQEQMRGGWMLRATRRRPAGSDNRAGWRACLFVPPSRSQSQRAEAQAGCGILARPGLERWRCLHGGARRSVVSDS